MKGYQIRKVYVIICGKCEEDITRPLGGEEPGTRAAAEAYAREHEKTWHSRPGTEEEN